MFKHVNILERQPLEFRMEIVVIPKHKNEVITNIMKEKTQNLVQMLQLKIFFVSLLNFPMNQEKY